MIDVQGRHIMQMQNSLHELIITKMVEAILQSRLDVKKSLFRQFDVVLKQFESSHSAPFGENIFKFLEALIVADLYKIRQRLIITNENGEVCAKVGVTFLLIERKTGDKTEAQVWEVDVHSKREITNASFNLITDIFRQLILFLNKKPLFRIYQKDKQLKSRFMLDYKVYFKGNETDRSLLQISTKDVMKRDNDQFSSRICCYYLSSLQHLKKIGLIDEEKSTNRKQSMTLSDYDGERKVSVYAFYDPVLDFTFLSSDDQSMRKKTQQKPQQIQIEQDGQDSDSFQMLLINQDQQFLEYNKEIFEMLASREKVCFDL